MELKYLQHHICKDVEQIHSESQHDGMKTETIDFGNDIRPEVNKGDKKVLEQL